MLPPLPHHQIFRSVGSPVGQKMQLHWPELVHGLGVEHLYARESCPCVDTLYSGLSTGGTHIPGVLWKGLGGAGRDGVPPSTTPHCRLPGRGGGGGRTRVLTPLCGLHRCCLAGWMLGGAHVRWPLPLSATPRCCHVQAPPHPVSDCHHFARSVPRRRPSWKTCRPASKH